jgi:DNA polymerase-3 subunit gamma/tau
MSDSPPSNSGPSADGARKRPGEYVVVARRYRPQVFEDLVGQEHVARALSNAIGTERVGHAYLFTGARGVGKTSAARILSKALNCLQGPIPVPCNQCDICQSIATGDDVDVLEIDGASNRGIDEIRQLRQNVHVRPSRARFKIYIIDEVHMLTREAFNALLKTLEEPPEHVKFIFCTTEPTKIPVTILSRCQRFDFAGISASSIGKRLSQIAEAEGIAAEPEALDILARRAAGSMRDAQSLLEQLLAFAPEQIQAAHVHAMLGTAGEERLNLLVDHIVRRDAAAALQELDDAAADGVDLSQLLEQLFGHLRDAMAAAVGCHADAFLYASPSSQEQVVEAGQRLGLETILASMQILDQTLARLRYSTQGRILAELAIVRLCALKDLEHLPALISQLQGAAGPTRSNPQAASSPPAGRENRLPSVEGASLAEPSESGKPAQIALSSENAPEIWSRVLARIQGMAAEHARHFDRVATAAPNSLVVQFKPGYTLAKSFCERPDQLAKFETALEELTGQPVRVQFRLTRTESTEEEPTQNRARTTSPHQRIAEVSRHPLIHRAGELFGAHAIRVDIPPEEQRPPDSD